MQKKATGWTIAEIKGINLVFCQHKIRLVEGKIPVVEAQRKLNPALTEMVKKELLKLLGVDIVSPTPCVPNKGCLTIVDTDKNELIPSRTVIGCKVCIDYRKLIDATKKKNHFCFPFIDQMLDLLACKDYYCFLDGYSGIPFGLCSAPTTFMRGMTSIFADILEDRFDLFMDKFLVNRNSFQECLCNLEKVLKIGEKTNLVLN
ncbi:Retrovirus-related Pol polyprotein from transposon 17.6 [Gossypium australe]|uniref:Retrovirus-related Pol polyprotein from transposon 17.6 n=1 Tax=Gossypium australe TaxID=47621 RepID=A0A5B6UY99_9ROSI|nr:Retrovirus-related Pol polyprotein from transposon 17.6 [Gossypium australe]